ncbi:MAG: hypothetical protein AAF388_02510 [Bacteroidota bacterium]
MRKNLLGLVIAALIGIYCVTHDPSNVANQKEAELLEYVAQFAPTRMEEIRAYTLSYQDAPPEQRAGIFYRKLLKIKNSVTINPESLADKSESQSNP